jgi:hypothetical protein
VSVWIARWAIEHHLRAEHLRVLQIAEASEREQIAGLLSKILETNNKGGGVRR